MVALLATCFATAASAQARRPGVINELSPGQQRSGWRLLFDGTTLAGWRGISDSTPPAQWKVENGAIHRVGAAAAPRMPDGQPATGGDLMTTGTWRDFELVFQWMVAPGANSGVKYNVSQEMSQRSPNRAALGFEYQVLDDSLNPDNKLATHRAGAVYDLVAPNETKRVMPAGQWNRSAILFRGNRGEHWLNGTRVAVFDLGTPQFESLLAASKYKDIAGFAERRTGHIVLQDHGDEVWFRNIKIRDLAP
jgi:hypothetical protein